MFRNANHQLGCRVQVAGWDSKLFLSPDTIDEFELCLKNFEFFNGAPIKRAQAFCPVFYPNQVNYLIDQVDPVVFEKPLNIFYSDSGAEAAYFFKSGGFVLSDEYMFSSIEKDLSSSYRELCAVRLAFDVHYKFFESQRSSIILWITDNQCVFSFLTKGSRIPLIQKMCINIKKAEISAGVTILPKWTSRNDINLQVADIGSKLCSSSDEYGLSHEFFTLVQSKFRLIFSIDAFASKNNKRTHTFISLVPQTGCSGVNFFHHNMKSSEIYYIHPPTSVLRQVFNKIMLYSDVTCVVILPCWASHNFWSFLVQQGYFRPFVKDYLLFDPFYVSFSKNSMFRGHMNFLTLALLIVTRESNKIMCPALDKSAISYPSK